MQRNVWSDIASWRTKQPSNCTKLQLHALMTITSKKKNWDLLEKCQKYALKLSWNACIWHELVDQTFYGQWTNLHEQSPNGPELVTNAWLVWFLIFIIHHTMWVSTAQQCRLGLVQDSDFGGELEDSKSILGRILCIFGSHTFVPMELDVQEANFGLTQFDGIWNYFSWCGFTHGRNFGIWSVKCCILLPTNLRNPKKMCREICCMTHHQENELNKRWDSNFSTTILNDATSIMFPQTWSLLNLVRCCTFLKIMKLWSRWSSKAEVRQWDTCPEPTELRLIGYLTESTWTLKSKSNMLTPKTNSQTYWQRAISHVMNGIIFSICSISAFSAQQAAPKWCRKECNKKQEERELWRSRSRRWTWSRMLRQALLQRRVRVHQIVPGILRAPSQQGSNLTAQSAGKTAAEGSNQNGAASSSQVWLTDAKNERQCEETRCCGNEPGSEFSRMCKETCRRKFRHQRRVVDSEWPNNFHRFRVLRSTPRENLLEPATTTQKRSQKTKWKTSMWTRWYGECLWLSLGKPQFILETIILEKWQSTKNQLQRTVKQLFDVTRKLIKEQKEIQGISMIDWQHSSWKRTTLLTVRAVRLSTAKAYEFSDSVLCMGRISENPASAWTEKINLFMNSSQCPGLDRIDGEPMEFEWTNFPGFTALQIVAEIQNMMTEIKCEPEQFPGRIIFMSMYNDIVWEKKETKKCVLRIL